MFNITTALLWNKHSLASSIFWHNKVYWSPTRLLLEQSLVICTPYHWRSTETKSKQGWNFQPTLVFLLKLPNKLSPIDYLYKLCLIMLYSNYYYIYQKYIKGQSLKLLFEQKLTFNQKSFIFYCVSFWRNI